MQKGVYSSREKSEISFVDTKMKFSIKSEECIFFIGIKKWNRIFMKIYMFEIIN